MVPGITDEQWEKFRNSAVYAQYVTEEEARYAFLKSVKLPPSQNLSIPEVDRQRKQVSDALSQSKAFAQSQEEQQRVRDQLESLSKKRDAAVDKTIVTVSINTEQFSYKVLRDKEGNILYYANSEIKDNDKRFALLVKMCEDALNAKPRTEIQVHPGEGAEELQAALDAARLNLSQKNSNAPSSRASAALKVTPAAITPVPEPKPNLDAIAAPQAQISKSKPKLSDPLTEKEKQDLDKLMQNRRPAKRTPDGQPDIQAECIKSPDGVYYIPFAEKMSSEDLKNLTTVIWNDYITNRALTGEPLSLDSEPSIRLRYVGESTTLEMKNANDALIRERSDAIKLERTQIANQNAPQLSSSVSQAAPQAAPQGPISMPTPKLSDPLTYKEKQDLDKLMQNRRTAKRTLDGQPDIQAECIKSPDGVYYIPYAEKMSEEALKNLTTVIWDDYIKNKALTGEQISEPSIRLRYVGESTTLEKRNANDAIIQERSDAIKLERAQIANQNAPQLSSSVSQAAPQAAPQGPISMPTPKLSDPLTYKEKQDLDKLMQNRRPAKRTPDGQPDIQAECIKSPDGVYYIPFAEKMSSEALKNLTTVIWNDYTKNGALTGEPSIRLRYVDDDITPAKKKENDALIQERSDAIKLERAQMTMGGPKPKDAIAAPQAQISIPKPKPNFSDTFSDKEKQELDQLMKEKIPMKSIDAFVPGQTVRPEDQIFKSSDGVYYIPFADKMSQQQLQKLTMEIWNDYTTNRALTIGDQPNLDSEPTIRLRYVGSPTLENKSENDALIQKTHDLVKSERTQIANQNAPQREALMAQYQKEKAKLESLKSVDLISDEKLRAFDAQVGVVKGLRDKILNLDRPTLSGPFARKPAPSGSLFQASGNRLDPMTMGGPYPEQVMSNRPKPVTPLADRCFGKKPTPYVTKRPAPELEEENQNEHAHTRSPSGPNR